MKLLNRRDFIRNALVLPVLGVLGIDLIGNPGSLIDNLGFKLPLGFPNDTFPMKIQGCMHHGDAVRYDAGALEEVNKLDCPINIKIQKRCINVEQITKAMKDGLKIH